jgi:hypothetical protein
MIHLALLSCSPRRHFDSSHRAITLGWAAVRELARNGLVGRTRWSFQRSDKSQLATAESPTSDRLAFALSLLETGLRMCPAEKNRDSDPILS